MLENFTWRVSDCDELVGVTQYMLTSFSSSTVFAHELQFVEVELQVEPFSEVSMVPLVGRLELSFKFHPPH